ncbi:MAG: phosphoglycerate dehydrogenase [Chloroflexi bacterium]|nr:phosphoglycerate dehydrogenase [Chloroflexota bacterium]MBM3174322.1 phosphoglycerate dehydrogenase [Chloroflexota bacterium]MBM4449453.1 phosphoglycerate dehydrogenase [Chloroflexota bacterium]
MKVLVADPMAEEGIEVLKRQVEVDVKLKLKPEELKSIIGDYEALIVRSETKATADIIEAGKKLQVIARAGVGLDNIDLEAATRKGIVVVNAPTGNTIAAAEHAIALMMALARHVPQANARLKSGVWQRSEYMGTELRGKTLGVVGLGNVGSAVARRAQAFEMRLIGYDPFVSSEYANNLGVELVSMDKLIRESDFITLHLPLNSDTKGLIGAKELSKMKHTARIINCARGGLVDEEALYKAVEAGKIAGAAVDVFVKEPVAENVLFKSDKIIVTPHLGASTAEAQTSVALEVVEQVLAVLRGQPARYAVNAPQIPAELLAVLAPYMQVASTLGSLARQLMEGQIKSIQMEYSGEIANYDTSAVKSSVIGGLLEGISEERINVVNAAVIANRRGIKIAEKKEAVCENYASLITLKVTTDAGSLVVAGTVLRGETHIVRVSNFWPDIIPTGGYFLFSDHRDCPGLIGAVGNITGKADINISSMQLARLQPRGQALMILALDEALPEAQLQEILALQDVHTAKLVKL